MPARRTVISVLTLGSLLCLEWTTRALIASADDIGTVRFRWRVPTVHKQTVEQNLQFQGTIEPEKEKKGVWVFVFAGVVLIPYLAKSILEIMRQVEHGGMVVDACGRDIQIETNKNMPLGMVIVRSCSDADVKVYHDQIEGPSQLAQIIEKARGSK